MESFMKDPYGWFGVWFDEAKQSEPDVPDSVAIATVDDQNRPSIRNVLLKDFDEAGFVFYTNFRSRKAAHIQSNPNVSMCFHWKSRARQVHIEGLVERVSDAESDAYFASRPRGSQVGAWASEQSQTMSGPGELVSRVEQATRRFEGQDVPRPPHWGGYRLIPQRFEFWQGKADRLHDRTAFEWIDGKWLTTMLFP